MILEGEVTNVANIGAFVDIGVLQYGLVHISALADRYVKDPRDVVRVGQTVKVKVQEVDIARKRVGLTMRLNDDAAPPARRGADARGDRPRGAGQPRAGRSEAGQSMGAMAAAFAKLKR